MASYRFKWPHSADSVIVTGSFDGWGQKIELEKRGRYWEKVVPLSATKDKIYYKYIVNGQWRVDPSHAVEKDHEGNENNVLDPEDVIYSTAIMNSVGPDATTVGLAGAAGAAGVAGAGAAVAAASSSKDETPMEIPKGTLQDAVVGVNPIPSTGTGSNPVNLKPGDPVPPAGTLTGNTIDSTVKHDKDTYERGAGGAAYSPIDKSGDTSSSAFGRPAAGGTFIPESSSFMNDTSTDNVNSVGPGATTTGLAGEQPIEPRGTPTVVKKEGGGDSDITVPAIIGGGAVAAGAAGAIASVGPDATSSKLAGEQPIEPRGEPTVVSKSSDQDPNISSVGPGATSTLLAGEQPIESRTGPQVLRKDDDKDNEVSEPVPIAGGGTALSSVGPGATTTGLAGAQPLEGDADRAVATTVPDEVKESQQEANVDPEASANPEAVEEKSAAEKELLSKVQETNAQGEPAPTDSAAATTTAPAATSSSGAPQLGDPTGGGLAPISMEDNKPTIATKEALLGEKKDGLNASAESEAKPSTAAHTAAVTAVAGTSSSAAKDGPSVTSGVGESSAPQTSTPQKRQSMVDRLKSSATPESSKTGESTPDSKKSKRRSFFKRLKDKLNS